MATDHKDVELRIRATDFSKKTIDGVVDSLNDMKAAQASQVDAAKKGEVSATALNAAYNKMEDALKALQKQFAVTKNFEDQATKLDALKAAADAARQAQTAYANSIADVETKTKAQTKTLADLASAVTKADAAQLRQQTTLDRTTAQLDKYGIATSDIAGAQAKIVASFTSSNAALEKYEQTLQTLDTDVLAFKTAQQQLADSQAKAAAESKAANDAMIGSAQAAAVAEDKLRSQRAADAVAAVDQAHAEALTADAMMKAAAQAEALANGYTTLARSVTSIRGNAVGDQIAGIVDPLTAATSNVQGLEGVLGQLQTKIAAINGPVKNFKQSITELNAVQAGVQGIAAQIDAYQRQIDTLRAARTEYSQARTAVRDLTTQMATGSGDAGALSKAMTASQAALRAAANAMTEAGSKANAMRDGLRAAGVDTRDLGKASEQLVTQAQRSVSALTDLQAGYRQYGKAAEDANTSQFKFFSGGRTTLSFVQRLRGELLALAAGFVGLQGGIGLAKDSIDAFNTTQKIQSQLGAFVGNDAKAISTEWEYLLNTANRIGFSFQTAAGAYAKFGIAAKSANISLQDTRFIFEKVATASRVAGLSSDDFEGVLKALEQMMSKGVIQAEELRGQLGDRLPGAFSIAAKGANMTTADFTKLMETGGISADYVINIARELGNVYQTTDKSANSLLAVQARFENAAFQFKTTLADNGFVDAYSQFLIQLTDLLKSDQGQELAKELGSAFTAVIKILGFLADNLDTIKLAFEVVAGVAITQWGVGLLGAANDVRKGFILLLPAIKNVIAAVTILPEVVAGVGVAGTAAAGGIGLLEAAFIGLRIAIAAAMRLVPLLAIAWAAFEAGKFVVNKIMSTQGPTVSPQFKLGADNKPFPVDQNGDKAGPSVANPNGSTAPGMQPTPDAGNGGTESSRTALAIQKELDANQKKLDKETRQSRLTADKKDLEDRLEIVNEYYDGLKKKATASITDQKVLQTTLSNIDKEALQARNNQTIKFHNDNDKADATAASRKVTLQNQVNNELEKIQADLAKSETKLDPTAPFEARLQTRMDAIAHQYDKLKKTIGQLSKVDPGSAAAATKTLDADIAQAQAIEATKAKLDEVKRLETELTNQQTLKNSMIERENALYSSGQETKADLLANTAAINTTMDAKITKAAADLKTFANANKSLLTPVNAQSINTKADVATAAASNPANQNSQAAINDQETKLNVILAQRQATLAQIDAERAGSLITEDQYADKVNATNNAYKNTIVTLSQGIANSATALEATGNLTEEQKASLDALIAKMQTLGTVTKSAKDQAGILQGSLNTLANSGLDTLLSNAGKSLTDMAQGTVSVKQGFEGLLTTTMQFFADFLLKIAEAIIKQQILNLLASSSSTGIAAAGKAAGGVASVAAAASHTGGVVGGPRSMTKTGVASNWFAGAPRFHAGGLPGISSDEVPTILQKGEEVLARNDPRNILNGGGTRSDGSAAGGSANKFVLVDDRTKIPEAMLSAEGENVTMVHIKRNITTLRQMLK